MADNLDERLSRISQNRMSRRGFLQAAGLTGAAAALAACTPSGSVATASPAASAPASAVAASVPASAAATPAPSYVIEKQLNMYNWAEYISPKNIDAFKKQYGV